MRIISLLLALAFFSCSQKESAVSQDSAFELSFSLDSLVQEKCIGQNCAKLRMVWPVAHGPQEEQINYLIQHQVNSPLVYRESSTLSRDSLVLEYFKWFEKEKNEFPEFHIGYEIDIAGDVTYVSDSTISIHFGWMSFLGGAHPSHGETFINWDKKAGKLLSQDQLVRDKAKLRELAEKKFKEFHEVEDGVSLDEDGRFFLPETGFFLASVMGIQDDKFWIIYTPYEIGPYVMGYTHLSFTKEELGDLVRW
jgi:hypothetical protein